MDPTAPTSLAVTGFDLLLYPTTTFSSLLLRSFKSEDSAKMAIISEAVTMSNPLSLRGALELPPMPVITLLKDLSSISVTLLKVISSGKKPGMRPR